MKLVLFIALFISAPLWAQDRIGIKGVTLGQTAAEMPTELAATCRPDLKGGSVCTLKFTGLATQNSPLATIVANPVKLWRVHMLGTPSVVMSIYAEVAGGNDREVYRAVAEKFDKECKRPSCSFFVESDHIVVGTILGETLIIITSEKWRVLKAAEAAAARKEL